jgi:hypothetical protein
MCLSVQPYLNSKARCPDEPVPASNAEKAEPGRSLVAADVMTDSKGLNYVAVRNCDLEQFGAK